MDQTRTLSGSGAPPAGKPGMGAGNVPFAPGVMSGQLGQATNPQQLARATAPQPGSAMPGSPPSPSGPGQPPAPGGGPMGGGIINPQVYFQVMNAWMESLIKATESPGNTTFGIY